MDKLTMNKTAQELYQEREKRFLDAIALKQPDRVPIVGKFSFFGSSGFVVHKIS